MSMNRAEHYHSPMSFTYRDDMRGAQGATLGIHLADDSVRACVLDASSRGAVVEAGALWLLEAGVVVDGFVRDRDCVAAVATEIAAWAGPVTGVRIALATPSLAVEAVEAADHGARRPGTIPAHPRVRVRCRMPSVGDLVVTAAPGAVARAVAAFAACGPVAEIDVLPLALLRVIPPRLLHAGSASLVLREGSWCWMIRLPELSVGVGRVLGFGAVTDLSLRADEGETGRLHDWFDGVDLVGELRRFAAVNQLAVAIGAAMGAVAGPVPGVDLRTGEQLAGGTPPDPVLAPGWGSWVLERVGPCQVPVATNVVVAGSRR